MATKLQLDALTLLQEEVGRSKRTTGVQFAPSFARSADTDKPPALARLFGAGRGGEVRLKLFLTFALRATSGRPTLPARRPRTLARMLGLPPETGPRRASDAMRWLATNRFLTISPKVGTPGEILLLDAADPPSDLPKRDRHGRYLSVPIDLWTGGLLLEMPARELAVYIALLDVTYDDDEGSMIRHQKRQYGISDDTWTRAVKGLVEKRLIVVRTEVEDDEERIPRVRHIYRRVAPEAWVKLS